MRRFLILQLLICVLPLVAAAQTPYDPVPRADLAGLSYELPLYPEDADHDPDIPAPAAVLVFPVGERAATSAQIDAYARLLTEASERVSLVEYGRSFEGRPLIYL